MSEGYIGLAPSYGVFQKQVIAGRTASTYDLDFDVVQSTQIMVSIDGIVQEPDWAFSIGRSSTGQMQITFAEALTVTTATLNTTAGSNSLTNVTTSATVYKVQAASISTFYWNRSNANADVAGRSTLILQEIAG